MINKNIVALGFVSFFTDMASSMVTSILPLFIVYVLNEGVDKLGYVVAIATFVSYIFRIFFGFLSDRYQIVKPFVVTGYIISAVTKPLLYFSHTYKSIALLRALERMGKAIRAASKDSLISAYSGAKSGKSFGFHKMLDVAGEMSGAMIAFLALYYLGKNENIFRDIFAFTLIPGIIAVIIVAFFVNDAPYKRKKTEFDFSKDRKLLGILVIYFLFVFFMFNDSFFIIKAKEAGIDMAFIPLFIVLYNFTQTVSSYYFGIQIDKIGSKSILSMGFVFGILSMLMLLYNEIVLAFIFLGIFTVSSLNAIRSYISNFAVNKSTVYGIFYGGVAISGALGAGVIGNIWQFFGEMKALYFSLTGLCVVFLYFIIKEIYVKAHN
ncbi:MFS transporter [Lebetimonas sp. JH292]|uniref:MFS transporter n=1 Tax=Lebetimonas sp. JH292 TaxID=990068 RepID=UPI0004653743|nr:MFS transporter [Lebetimonas sp. JH292]